MSLADLDAKTIITIASPVLPAIATIYGAFLVFRGNLLQRGTYAKQLHVIEVATKRTEYSTGYLKAIELVNGPDSESYAKAKDEVNNALRRIQDKADAEMKRLSWGRQIERSLR